MQPEALLSRSPLTIVEGGRRLWTTRQLEPRFAPELLPLLDRLAALAPRPHPNWMLADPPRLAAALRHHLQDRPLPTEPLREDVLLTQVGRPRPDLRLDQQPCLPWSAQFRAQQLARSARPGQRALFLGDDDLVSLAAQALGVPCSLEVVDLGASLLRFLQARLSQGRPRGEDPPLSRGPIHVRRYDAADSFAPEHDFVLTDPPYAADGMAVFLEAARQALRRGGTLLLSTCPLLLEKPLNLVGFALQERFADVNLYPALENIGRAGQDFLALYELPADPWAGLFEVPILFADLFVCLRTADPG